MTETPIRDHEFDASDLRAINALSAGDLEAIDHALQAACKYRWLKLARVVGEAMHTLPDKYHDLPDMFYSQRVRELVNTGRLESQGNLFFMRFSEVRLSRVRITENMSAPAVVIPAKAGIQSFAKNIELPTFAESLSGSRRAPG